MILEASLQWRYYDTPSNLVMPWLTLPTLQWLKSIDISQWKVFEYGCGYSTIWFKAHVWMVQSVDTEQSWAKSMGAFYSNDKEQYIARLHHPFTATTSLWDCVIVDGAWREDCARFAKDYIKPGGYMIIDNWQQEDYPVKSCEATDEFLMGWERTLHRQENHSEWCSAVWRKPL